MKTVSSDIVASLRAQMAVAIALVLAFAFAFAPSATAQNGPRPHVTVAGEASVAVEPDLAQLRAGVTSEARTAREAAQANAKLMKTVMSALRELDIAERDVQTARYTIHPTYESGPGQRNRLTGFQVANSLLIKVRDVQRLGEIVDRLVAAGVNTMGSIEFIVSDPSKLMDDARQQAFADARRRAAIFADAAGLSLGPAHSIAEQVSGIQPPTPMVAMRSTAATETPIAPGERTLRLQVTVSFDLLR